jgi:hypothetical protein
MSQGETMSKPRQTRGSSRTRTSSPSKVDGFDSLAELALDMRWSWNHCADEVWKQLDPVLWELTHNPWVVLPTVSRDQVGHVLADAGFCKRVDELVQSKRQAAEAPAWGSFTPATPGVFPQPWIARMRESMARLTPRFSTNRTVRQYTEEHYLPAAAAYRKRAADKGALGARIVDWQHTLEEKWAALRFGEVKVESGGKQHAFEVQVHLNGLDPSAVRVELYAEGVKGGGPVRVEMMRGRKLAGAVCGYVYGASVSATRPATDYTARVVPDRSGVALPLEAPWILWQR